MLNSRGNQGFLVDKTEIINWKNENIIDYYGNIPVEEFRNLAIRGGFEDGVDIDLIYPYISETHSILDIGSAYGRVIRNLISRKYAGQIYAIERSKNFYQHIKNNYSNYAKIIHSSIQDFEPLKKVDVILWMWSGINDFAKEEHLLILKRMASWLKSNGILILETLLHTLTPINASVDDKNTFTIFSEYGTLHSYKTSKQEIEEYGAHLGFPYIKHIHYETVTKRPRILHLLSYRPI